MSIYQFFVILNSRKFFGFFVLTLTLVAGAAVSIIMPKTYEATATLVVNYKGADPVTGTSVPAQLMPGYMATQAEIISSPKVALKVVDKLSVYSDPNLIEAFYKDTEGEGDIRNWIADLLLEKLTVTPSRESSLINLTYESNSASHAAIFANTFADAYIETSLELKVEPSKRAAIWFEGQVDELRQNLINAQEALTQYQKEKGIIAIDERLDVENSRLVQLSQQLVSAQGELLALSSQQKIVQTDGEEGKKNEALLLDPVLRDYKTSLARAEVRLAELKQRVSKNHPDYRAASVEVWSLKTKLKKELESLRKQMTSRVEIAEKTVTDLELAISEQKTMMFEINKSRDKLNLLKSDVEDAQKILSAATQRLNQTSLQGASSESDVSVLNSAVVPTSPSKPNLIINMFIAVVFGIALGIGSILLMELFNRRVRSVQDVVVDCNLPVLGEVMYSKPAKRRFWKRKKA